MNRYRNSETKTPDQTVDGNAKALEKACPAIQPKAKTVEDDIESAKDAPAK